MWVHRQYEISLTVIKLYIGQLNKYTDLDVHDNVGINGRNNYGGFDLSTDVLGKTWNKKL